MPSAIKGPSSLRPLNGVAAHAWPIWRKASSKTRSISPDPAGPAAAPGPTGKAVLSPS